MTSVEEGNRTASKQSKVVGRGLVVLLGVFIGGGECFRRTKLSAPCSRKDSLSSYWKA